MNTGTHAITKDLDRIRRELFVLEMSIYHRKSKAELENIIDGIQVDLQELKEQLDR